MQAPQLMYSLGSLALICYLISKAENRWFLGVVLFWLFSGPILGDPRYTLSFQFAGIDLQPSRILFLLLSAILFFFVIRARIGGKSLLEFSVHQLRFYELWLVIYISIAVLVIVLNFNELGAQKVIVDIIKLLTFLLIYFFARACISQRDFHLLAMAIVVFAILSSLVAVYQFFGDASFFRLGATRNAFGSYMRANGLFFSEYEQGFFLTTALIVGRITIKSKWGMIFIYTLLPLGVFFTMHRASWLVLIVSLIMIVMREIRRTYLWILAGAALASISLFVFLNSSPRSKDSGGFVDLMIKTRVQDNTLDVRLSYDQFALDMIRKYPLGIGCYDSAIYSREAYKESMEFLSGGPMIIHNGFLAAGLLYGITGMIAFTLFILTTLFHYIRRKLWSTPIGFMVVCIMTSLLLINITQDFSFLGEQTGLFLGLLIGAALPLNSDVRNFRPAPFQKQTEG